MSSIFFVRSTPRRWTSVMDLSFVGAHHADPHLLLGNVPTPSLCIHRNTEPLAKPRRTNIKMVIRYEL